MPVLREESIFLLDLSSRSLVCTGSHQTRLKVFVTLLRGTKQMSQHGCLVKEIFIEKGNHEVFYSMIVVVVVVVDSVGNATLQ